MCIVPASAPPACAGAQSRKLYIERNEDLNMAAINLKPLLDKIMEAINAGGKRLEAEAEQFGYGYAKAADQNQEETNQATTDKE